MKISDVQRYDSKKMYEAYDYWPKSAKEHYEKDFSDFRWALDYESDMKLIREIISRIKNRPILMNDIISLLENNPKLREINRAHLYYGRK